MTRAQAAAYLDSQFASLATEIGQTLRNDTGTGYGPDIDAALRRLDVAEAGLDAATVEDSERVVFYALCDYACLQRMARRLATRVDSGALVPEGDRDRVFANVRAMLAEATAVVVQLGYGPEAADQWGWVDFNTDYIEPTSTASEYTLSPWGAG